jgi:hypothetical protein
MARAPSARVQSLDGVPVVFHDANLRRLCGERRASTRCRRELTAASRSPAGPASRRDPLARALARAAAAGRRRRGRAQGSARAAESAPALAAARGSERARDAGERRCDLPSPRLVAVARRAPLTRAVPIRHAPLAGARAARVARRAVVMDDGDGDGGRAARRRRRSKLHRRHAATMWKTARACATGNHHVARRACARAEPTRPGADQVVAAGAAAGICRRIASRRAPP